VQRCVQYGRHRERDDRGGDVQEKDNPCERHG
jgi:hypothetical protein